MSDVREAVGALRVAASDGRLDRVCDEVGLALVVLFGSGADLAHVGEPADVDIAVLPRDPQTFDRAVCTTAFVDLLHTDRVDVLDLSRAGVVVRARALGDGIPLYEQAPGLYARAQLQAVPQAMELGWLTDLELALLATR